ncbi:hypothetical protein GGR50DRAFT_391623 [Xylaria sp. CBS 124048]|nr:hypothetical protein GGR50DRAFT_391623 [Xylaria sp. CBS 124048]
MARNAPGVCFVLQLHEWNRNEGWQYRQVDLHEFFPPRSPENIEFVSADAEICIIFANTDLLSKCEPCRSYLIDEFSVPKYWWSQAHQNSNGYFGCRDGTRYISTWTYFEMKQLEGGDEYSWYKLNVYIQWDRSTHKTIVLAFDTDPVVAHRLLNLLRDPDPDCLCFPFWFYPHLLSEVARIEESAVWAIRDEVRAIETQVVSRGRPKPNYRHMHDIARHGIHVTETLDVAVETLQRMLDRHDRLLQKDRSDDIHSQLQFFDSFIASMRCRSVSNDKRLLNEIQLAFNTVAQHDASTSLKVAVVALIFLPPTFVSAIFSMSFFNFSPDKGWFISDKFWLYWVFAVPTTIVTAAGWYYLRRYGMPELPNLKREAKRSQAFPV